MMYIWIAYPLETKFIKKWVSYGDFLCWFNVLIGSIESLTENFEFDLFVHIRQTYNNNNPINHTIEKAFSLFYTHVHF